jgi:hypothetical protein
VKAVGEALYHESDPMKEQCGVRLWREGWCDGIVGAAG